VASWIGATAPSRVWRGAGPHARRQQRGRKLPGRKKWLEGGKRGLRQITAKPTVPGCCSYSSSSTRSRHSAPSKLPQSPLPLPPPRRPTIPLLCAAWQCGDQRRTRRTRRKSAPTTSRSVPSSWLRRRRRSSAGRKSTWHTSRAYMAWHPQVPCIHLRGLLRERGLLGGNPRRKQPPSILRQQRSALSGSRWSSEVAARKDCRQTTLT